MALLTYSAQAKDQEVTVTLDIVELEAISKVSNSVQSNKSSWSGISLSLVNPTNNQIVNIPFRYAGEASTIQSPMTVSSAFVGNNALISSIVIVDKANGYVRLERSDIPSVSSYDLIFTPAFFFEQAIDDGSVLILDDLNLGAQSIEQEYTPASNATISSMFLKGRKVGNPTGAITVYFIEDILGTPTNVGGYTIDASNFSTSTEYIELLPENSPVFLQSIYKYRLLIEPPTFGGSMDNSNYIELTASNSDTITGHSLIYKSNATPVSQSGDLTFRLVDSGASVSAFSNTLITSSRIALSSNDTIATSLGGGGAAFASVWDSVNYEIATNGKIYYEVEIEDDGTGHTIGLFSGDNAGQNPAFGEDGGFILGGGGNANGPSVVYANPNGPSGHSFVNYGTSPLTLYPSNLPTAYSTGDRIGFAVDCVNRKFWIIYNGTTYSTLQAPDVSVPSSGINLKSLSTHFRFGASMRSNSAGGKTIKRLAPTYTPVGYTAV